MSKFIPTRLYIKQHSITGLKYFGKTISNNIESYTGSGKRWIYHIRKHGKKYIKTLWVSEWFYSKEDIIKVALQLSEEYNIVESNEWANLKPETGIDGGMLPDYALKSISNKLTGRTKETHEYIRLAAEKKSSYNMENSEWMRNSRKKCKETINLLSKEERNEKFGHICTDENRKKLSSERLGQTKEICERTRKMSETKKARFKLMTEDEKKKRFSTNAGKKWFHSDLDRKSILINPSDVYDDYILGRKVYEN
jgi:hypothetical protein